MNTSCHGKQECLSQGSRFWIVGRLLKFYQKPASYVMWWGENVGWRAGLKHVLARVLHLRSEFKSRSLAAGARAACMPGDEVLGLQPGELVEVKPVEDILATLDDRRRHRGLLWMTGMQKHCGKQYRVHRRVERIMLESNGQMRSMKNTVLLEGTMCDGAQFGGCDRSCFHFWREVWLRRVTPEPTRLDLAGGGEP